MSRQTPRRWSLIGHGASLVATFVILASPAARAEAIPHLAVPAATGPEILGIPVEFLLFGAMLIGVALYHHLPLAIAGSGLASIVVYKLAVTGFKTGSGFEGLALHLEHEAVVLSNLFLLLVGFALLARHFEKSQVPETMPAILPDNWTGGLSLLVLVFVLSGFLDNIAAALIGGTAAGHVYRGKVHLSYLAAIVAAANAGGAGSVLGDTTTTMMWIDGVSPLVVLEAYVAAVASFVIFATIAARQQHSYNPILKDPVGRPRIDWAHVGIVIFILVAAVVANVSANLFFPALLDQMPVLGMAVVLAILLAAPIRMPEWALVPIAAKTALFLLSLVLAASLMPVEALPAASWQTALGLGFVSSVFDNIPLTALALRQGGYDWGFLAYAVGYGGSMVWFGSSAGVALSNLYPESRDAIAWLRAGWHVPVGYIIGFLTMLAIVGWHPDEPHREVAPLPAATAPGAH